MTPASIRARIAKRAAKHQSVAWLFRDLQRAVTRQIRQETCMRRTRSRRKRAIIAIGAV